MLVFGYTIRPGDMDPKGIGVILGTEDAGFGGGSTIKAKGTTVDRNPWYLGIGHQPEHKVDTEPPAVSSVSITSRPANGEAYNAGETITVEVAFHEGVTPSGDIRLELDVGGVARRVTLQSVPEGRFIDSLVFDYTVQEGDTDGIGIDANSVKLNGGSIYANAGNSAGLSHDAVAADSRQKVEGSAGG